MRRNSVSDMRATGFPIGDLKKVIDSGTKLTVTSEGAILGLIGEAIFHVNANTVEIRLSLHPAVVKDLLGAEKHDR